MAGKSLRLSDKMFGGAAQLFLPPNSRAVLSKQANCFKKINFQSPDQLAKDHKTMIILLVTVGHAIYTT